MPHKPFIHLHTHSYYSFLEGLAAPADLVQAAARYEMPALALTDRIGLTGAVEFYLACQEAGLQAILGLQLPVASPLELIPARGDLVLLATDRAGWSSLCRLSSAMLTDHAEDPGLPLPWEDFSSLADGLLCLTGGPRGPLVNALREGGERAAVQYLGELAEVFPERLYLEVGPRTPADRELSDALARLGRKQNLPLVATQEVFYLSPERAAPELPESFGDPGNHHSGASEAGLQRLVTAIRLNKRFDEVAEEDCAPSGAYFTTPEEMAARFSDYPEAHAATQEIAERCRQFSLPLGKPLFPEISLPEGQTAVEVLRRKAEVGAIERYGKLSGAIRARLESELSVIEAKGYAPLFLIVEEILDYARSRGVPISSRGSAASSLVAYCTRITSPDPLRLNLYFERFLNPARESPPDIDTDLCSRRRDEVIRFVYEQYGAEKVAMVGTINRFRRRSALRETAKSHGLPASEISNMVEMLPWRWHRHTPTPRGSAYSELAGKYQGDLHQTIFRQAEALIGLPRHLSVHAGGIVIAPGVLSDIAPTQLASKGIVITQFDLESIARLGLVKIDLLGIRGLSVLGDVAAAIRDRDPKSYVTPLAALDAIPDRDPQTAQLVQEGRTIGCFQIESPGMQATLKEVQARSIDDVMVALALYRPGPLTGGLKDAFVRRHRGEEEVIDLHPKLSSLLEDTHGVILYQEQVLRIAHELAGLSLEDADLLRRAMSHFDPGEQMRTLRARFIAGARARAAVPEETAGRIWELMAAFAGYGFPKAHAASYAQIAWQSAWCKAHAPEIFMAAVLANWGGYYGQRVYLTEARRLGLQIRPPQVNFARREFSAQYPDGKATLFMGLDQVRDLTRRTQARILRGQPFGSLDDFLARVDPRPVEAGNLARCGALADFGEIPRLLQRLEGIKSWRAGQLPLFAYEGSGAEKAVEDWTLAERVAAQEAVLGAGVDAHPLDLVADQIAEAGALSTVEAAGEIGQVVRVAGTRFSWRRSRDERGDYVYIMALEDLTGMLYVIVPARVYRSNRLAFSEKNPLIVEGEVRLDKERGEPVIEARKAWRIKKGS